MVTLVKSRSKLTRQRDVLLPEVWFVPEEEPFWPEVGVGKQKWDEMGQPDVITVTIEPGDRLNEGKSTIL